MTEAGTPARASARLPHVPHRPPIRVMIVEDSLVVRQLLTHIVGRDPRLSVAAAVASGEEALQELGRVRPDVISMDIRLPGMDGLETTRQIMSERPTPIVVVAGAVEDQALAISMNALKAGALSVVEKPIGLSSAGYETIAEAICTQLVIMSEVPVIRRRQTGREQAPNRLAATEDDRPPSRPAALGIAASTGGPPALAKVLSALPADLPVPVLLVQHMGATFMAGFASWLDGLVPLAVSIARHGEPALPGHVYVAPGDRHLVLGPDGLLLLSDAPAVGGQRPAATMLFDSMAERLGARGLGVLLTGMGEDGARGLAAMRRTGAYTVTEDESTAVVYGMPAAAVRLGGSRLSLPLPMIGPHVLRLMRGEG